MNKAAAQSLNEKQLYIKALKRKVPDMNEREIDNVLTAIQKVILETFESGGTSITILSGFVKLYLVIKEPTAERWVTKPGTQEKVLVKAKKRRWVAKSKILKKIIEFVDNMPVPKN